MASAGDGERPALPDTDDPYVLLGIAPDADLKAIRQAYARLIRIYRPDRSPKEFQRIHAAFQDAQPREHPRLEDIVRRIQVAAGETPAARRAMGTGVLPAEGPAQRPCAEGPAAEGPDSADAAPSAAGPAAVAALPSTTPRPEDAERALAADVARRLDMACRCAASGDGAGAVAIVDALLDERASLDLLAGTEDHARLLARHPSLSWTRLVRASKDADAIRAVWNLAWLDAYEHDLPRARALLDDDRLLLDAADDEHLAAICLLRVSSLVWTSGRGLATLHARYRAAIPPHPELDDLIESISLEIHAASSLGQTVNPRSRALIDALHALLASARIGDLARRRRAARVLLAALERDLDATLVDLDALHDEVALAPVFEALYTHLPDRASRLDRLDKAVFDQLTRALYDIGREPHKWKAIGGALGATVLAGTGVGLFPGLAVFAGSVGWLLGTEGMRYRRSIRPGLARLLLRVPVTTWVLSRWVRINGRLAGRLSRFDVAIDADRALYALSMFASAAITIGELDASDEPELRDADGDA